MGIWFTSCQSMTNIYLDAFINLQPELRDDPGAIIAYFEDLRQWHVNLKAHDNCILLTCVTGRKCVLGPLESVIYHNIYKVTRTGVYVALTAVADALFVSCVVAVFVYFRC